MESSSAKPPLRLLIGRLGLPLTDEWHPAPSLAQCVTRLSGGAIWAPLRQLLGSRPPRLRSQPVVCLGRPFVQSSHRSTVPRMREKSKQDSREGSHRRPISSLLYVQSFPLVLRRFADRHRRRQPIAPVTSANARPWSPSKELESSTGAKLTCLRAKHYTPDASSRLLLYGAGLPVGARFVRMRAAFPANGDVSHGSYIFVSTLYWRCGCRHPSRMVGWRKVGHYGSSRLAAHTLSRSGTSGHVGAARPVCQGRLAWRMLDYQPAHQVIYHEATMLSLSCWYLRFRLVVDTASVVSATFAS